MRTLSVEQVERMTAQHFIVRSTTSTYAFAMVALALTALFFLGGASLGFFGTYVPAPANDAILQRELWSFWRRHKNLFQDLRFIFLANSVFFYVFYRIAKKQFSAARSSSNWVLRVGSDGVYVKYRSHLHDQGEDDGVFFFPQHEIERIRAEIRHGWRALFNHGSTRRVRVRGQKKTFLIISLPEDADTAFLHKKLMAERPRVAGTKVSGARKVSVRWQFIHAPVSFTDSGELRLEIDCSEKKLKSIMQVLSTWLDVSPTAHLREESIDFMSEEMIWKKAEQFILEGDETSARTLLEWKLGFDKEQTGQLIQQYRETGSLQSLRRQGIGFVGTDGTSGLHRNTSKT